MQKGNQKAIDRQCKKVIRRLWTDNAKRRSEGGGQTMQKGNQKAVVYPPPSDYIFALSDHRLLITFLHCLSTAF